MNQKLKFFVPLFHLFSLFFLFPPIPLRAETIGVVADLIGEARVEREGKLYRLYIGVPLSRGDKVSTLENAKIRILLKDESVLSMGPKTTVDLAELNIQSEERSFSLRVLVGRFKLQVAQWFYGPTRGSVETPTAIAGVRGTTLWGDTERDAICALEGKIEVSLKDQKEKKNLKEGECVSRMREGRLQPLKPTPEELKTYLDEVMIR